MRRLITNMWQLIFKLDLFMMCLYSTMHMLIYYPDPKELLGTNKSMQFID